MSVAQFLVIFSSISVYICDFTWHSIGKVSSLKYLGKESYLLGSTSGCYGYLRKNLLRFGLCDGFLNTERIEKYGKYAVLYRSDGRSQSIVTFVNLDTMLKTYNAFSCNAANHCLYGQRVFHFKDSFFFIVNDNSISYVDLSNNKVTSNDIKLWLNPCLEFYSLHTTHNFHVFNVYSTPDGRIHAMIGLTQKTCEGLEPGEHVKEACNGFKMVILSLHTVLNLAKPHIYMEHCTILKDDNILLNGWYFKDSKGDLTPRIVSSDVSSHVLAFVDERGFSYSFDIEDILLPNFFHPRQFDMITTRFHKFDLSLGTAPYSLRLSLIYNSTDYKDKKLSKLVDKKKNQWKVHVVSADTTVYISPIISIIVSRGVATYKFRGKGVYVPGIGIVGISNKNELITAALDGSGRSKWLKLPELSWRGNIIAAEYTAPYLMISTDSSDLMRLNVKNQKLKWLFLTNLPELLYLKLTPPITYTSLNPRPSKCGQFMQMFKRENRTPIENGLTAFLNLDNYKRQKNLMNPIDEPWIIGISAEHRVYVMTTEGRMLFYSDLAYSNSEWVLGTIFDRPDKRQMLDITERAVDDYECQDITYLMQSTRLGDFFSCPENRCVFQENYFSVSHKFQVHVLSQLGKIYLVLINSPVQSIRIIKLYEESKFVTIQLPCHTKSVSVRKLDNEYVLYDENDPCLFCITLDNSTCLNKRFPHYKLINDGEYLKQIASLYPQCVYADEPVWTSRHFEGSALRNVPLLYVESNRYKYLYDYQKDNTRYLMVISDKNPLDNTYIERFPIDAQIIIAKMEKDTLVVAYMDTSYYANLFIVNFYDEIRETHRPDTNLIYKTSNCQTACRSIEDFTILHNEASMLCNQELHTYDLVKCLTKSSNVTAVAYKNTTTYVLYGYGLVVKNIPRTRD